MPPAAPAFDEWGPWTIVQWLLIAAYVVAPLVLLANVARLWRTPERRTAILTLLTTWLAGAFLGAGLVFIYAFMIGGSLDRARPTQVLLTAYFAIGLLALLKGLDFLTRRLADRGMHRLSRDKGRWTQRSYRSIGTLARFLVLTTIGLPFVMAAAMTYRVKVTAPETPLSTFDAPYDAIMVETADGVDIALWWIATEEPSISTVLVVPGLGSGKADILPVCAFLRSGGHNVLVLDPRAHGDSGGQLTSFGDRERLDVQAAALWVRNEHAQESRDFYGLGISMGGAALLAAAGQQGEGRVEFDALAVIDTYDDLSLLADDLVTRQFEFAPPVRWMARLVALPLAMAHSGRPLGSFRPSDYVVNLFPAPLLVVHSEDDDLIPFAAGKRLYEAAEDPRRSHWVTGLDHNAAMINRGVLNAVAKFFEDAASYVPVV